MDNRIVKLAILEALSIVNLRDDVVITLIGNTVWLRDTRRFQNDARWCHIDIDGPILTIQNGRPCPPKLDLSHPNSIDRLGKLINDGLTITKLYINDNE